MTLTTVPRSRTLYWPTPHFLLATLCFLLFASSLVSACSKGQRQTTLHATVLAVNAARDGFLAWDRAHQDSIVQAATTREEAERKLAEYRKSQDKIRDGFTVAYETLAVAATQTDDASLSSAIRAVSDLMAAIQQLGVPIGTPAEATPTPPKGA